MKRTLQEWADFLGVPTTLTESGIPVAVDPDTHKIAFLLQREFCDLSEFNDERLDERCEWTEKLYSIKHMPIPFSVWHRDIQEKQV